jgi:hypothetical protein
MLQPDEQTTAPQRLAYLDNLKMLLVVGVIAVHGAVICGFDGSWYLESYDGPPSGRRSS